MTMICSSADSQGRVTAITDVLTWLPYHLAPEVVGNVPLAGGPLPKRRGTDAVAKPKQKMVTFGQTMVLWAGDVAIARAILTLLYEDTKHGTKYINDFERRIAGYGLSETELCQVSLIYHYQDGIRSRRHAHNVNIAESVDATILHEGTGGWNFLDDRQIDMAYSGIDQEKRHRIHWIARMSTAIVDELIDQSTQDYGYGGWLEFAETRGPRIEKIPYALKFWKKSKGCLLSGPTMFSVYEDHHLCVCVLHSSEDGAIKPDFCRIQDFLRRVEPTGYPLRWDVQFVIHLVETEGRVGFGVHIEESSDGFKWDFSVPADEFDPKNLRARLVMDEALGNRLYNNEIGTSGARMQINRPSLG